jgi:hypothetical protein
MSEATNATTPKYNTQEIVSPLMDVPRIPIEGTEAILPVQY